MNTLKAERFPAEAIDRNLDRAGTLYREQFAYGSKASQRSCGSVPARRQRRATPQSLDGEQEWISARRRPQISTQNVHCGIFPSAVRRNLIACAFSLVSRENSNLQSDRYERHGRPGELNKSALVKLRPFAENLTKDIYRDLRLPKPDQPIFVDLLKNEAFLSVTPRVVLDKLHALRIHGNTHPPD